jgi:hypothetical protein
MWRWKTVREQGEVRPCQHTATTRKLASLAHRGRKIMAARMNFDRAPGMHRQDGRYRL